MPSNLVQKLSPFYVMEVLEHAKKLESGGRDIVHFEVGEPDFATPREICEAAIQNLLTKVIQNILKVLAFPN